MKKPGKVLEEIEGMDKLVFVLRKVTGYKTSAVTLVELYKEATEALKSHPFVVSGGFARSSYAPTRTTQDLDFTILAQDLEKIEEALVKAAFIKVDTFEFQKPKRFIHKFRYDDKDLDLMIFEDQEFSQSVINRARKGKVNVIDPESLVIQKLISFRDKDKDDIKAIQENQKLDLFYIKRWLSKFKILDRYSFLDGA